MSRLLDVKTLDPFRGRRKKRQAEVDDVQVEVSELGSDGQSVCVRACLRACVVCVRVRARARVCVCACARARACACMCVCLLTCRNPLRPTIVSALRLPFSLLSRHGI